MHFNINNKPKPEVIIEDDDGMPGVIICGKRYAFFQKKITVTNKRLIINLGYVVGYEEGKFPVNEGKTNCKELVGCLYARYGFETIIKVNGIWYILECIEYKRSTGCLNKIEAVI